MKNYESGITRMKEDEIREMEKDQVIWADLSRDILGLIIARLSAPEVLMFRCVCKSWQQWFETSSYQSYLGATLTSMRSSDDVTRFPVLMTVHRNFCSFFHPMYNTTIRKVIPELVDARLFHTKGEWALLARRMERGDDDSIVIFFFNVNTMVKIDVPLSVRPNGFTFLFDKMCFFSNPDSADWSIIGTNGCFIGTIKHGQPSWTVSLLHNYGIWANPIAVVNREEEELCYSLGRNGTLFSFDPTKITSTSETRLHKVSKKPPLPLQYNRHHVQIVERFLVNVKGEEEKEDGVLLAIFKYKINTRVGKKKEDISLIPLEETYTTSVYEFNIANSEWRKLDNLGNRMLFVARTGSMLFQVGEEASNKMITKNKVYYPNVQTGNSIFYSLATESDHCFLLNHNIPCHDYGSLVNNKKRDNNYLPSYSPSNCGWIGHMPKSFFPSI